MACDFCATGRLGLSRNLSAEEIVGTFLHVRDEAPGRVTGAVFMGQGEPFANYDSVLQAALVLRDPCGGRIAAEAITISTVGLVPAIRRFTSERQPFKLIVSLTSAIEAKRARLLPVAGRTPLGEVLAAAKDHALATRQRITFAWVVLGGINTGDDEVDALSTALPDIPCQLNIIDVNDARPAGYVRATEAELRAFTAKLQRLGIPIVRRYSVGRDRHSACGMLAGLRLGEIPSPPLAPPGAPA
jgi:23S rRNA (adenine2503-C2)-methyltransferase